MPSLWKVAAYVVAAVVALGLFSALADGEGVAPAAPLVARTGADLDASVVKVILPGGHGSGVVIGDGTLVLTAAHVAENAPNGEIVVVTQDGTAIDGRVVWVAVHDDVALIEIETALPPVPLQCAPIAVGQAVEAVGHPNAGFQLDWLHTYGHVSAHYATIPSYNAPVLMFDAHVYRGNSGGPLFNMAGEIVGIVFGITAAPISFDSIAPFGFNLAVPASRVCEMFP